MVHIVSHTHDIKLHPIFTVSGPPGSGKSTLCERLARSLGYSYIAFDDHSNMTKLPIDQVFKWINDGGHFDELFTEDFRLAVLQASQTKPVIAETPFGPLHENGDFTISRSIWLHIDYDIALARVLKKEIRSEDWSNINQLQSWLEHYLNHYQSFVHDLLVKQYSIIKPICSVSIDANQPEDSVFKEAQAIIDR